MSSSTEGKVEAVANARSKIPEPIPKLSKSKLRCLQTLQHSDDVNTESCQEKFEYFPFLPIEVRDMIWEAAIPHPEVITVSVQIKSCDTTAASNEHGCQEDPSLGHDRSLFTFAASDNEFGVMMACKESRFIGLRALPNSLPTTYSQLAGIRYNPVDSAIRILNFKKILSAFGNEGMGEDDKWFCPRTHRGQGITALVVPAPDIWQTDPGGYPGYCWAVNDDNWERILQFMFKDVNKVIVEIDLSDNYTLPDLDFDGWSVQDKYEGDDAEEEIVENTKEEKYDKKDLQRLENLMNDLWLNIIDEVGQDRQIKPKFYFTEGTFGDRAIPKSLPWRNIQSRFYFGS